MFCSNCGNEIPDDSVFCDKCGTRLDAGGPAAEETYRPSPNIELCDDGVYRWIYEFNMLKNPVILGTVFKIFGCLFGIIFIFAIIGSVRSNGFAGAIEDLIPLFIFIIVFSVIIVISYIILAAMYGWKYIVLFEMDETEVRHTQQPKQFTKAQGIAWLAGLARASRVNLAAGLGQDLMVSGHNSLSSEFDKVKKVKVMRAFNTIKVNETLNHNQVYAEKEDFDFVMNYILQRIPDTAKRNV